jgi:hypothetical protein
MQFKFDAFQRDVLLSLVSEAKNRSTADLQKLREIGDPNRRVVEEYRKYIEVYVKIQEALRNGS